MLHWVGSRLLFLATAGGKLGMHAYDPGTGAVTWLRGFEAGG